MSKIVGLRVYEKNPVLISESMSAGSATWSDYSIRSSSRWYWVPKSQENDYTLIVAQELV